MHAAPLPPTTDGLIDYIVSNFHGPLWEELPEVEAMAHREARLHLHLEPRLDALHTTVVAIRRELGAHLEKEERVLFRWIRSGDPRAERSIALMHNEHAELTRLMERVRWLTDDFAADVGKPWHSLYESLALLDDALTDLTTAERALFQRATPLAAK